MATDWHDRIANNILPLSIEKENVYKALQEWFYTWECFDLEEPIENCEICDQENLRYQFEIQNKLNSKTMLIGSECIKRFDIPVYKDGERLSKDDAAKLVQNDRNKLIQKSKFQSVVSSLVSLTTLDEEFDIENFLNYYQENKAFNANRLSAVIWRLEKHNVSYTKTHFKMSMRTSVEKQQFLELDDWKYKRIKPCLSKHQIDAFEKVRGKI